MRRHLHLVRALLPVAAVVGGTVPPLATTPASASVPGLDYTVTACESDTDSIARLYQAAFGRDAEVGGFDYWVDDYAFGTRTYLEIAYNFVFSAEFVDTYGDLDDGEFVRQIYRNVLGREGDAAGVAFWESELVRWRAEFEGVPAWSGGGDRARLLARFAESPENIERTGTTFPALGPFNEGRAGTTFACGPSPEPALPGEGDLAGAWGIDDFTVGPMLAEIDLACDAYLDPLPNASARRLVPAAEGGALADASVEIALLPFATERGPERRLARFAQLLDGGCDVAFLGSTFEPVAVAPIGDEVLAASITLDGQVRPEPYGYGAMVRVGTRLAIVEVTDVEAGDGRALLDEALAVVAARLTDLG